MLAFNIEYPAGHISILISTWRSGSYSLSGFLEAASVAELPISTSGIMNDNSALELKDQKCLFRAKRCGDKAARQEEKKS
jgi:hypothetical protein